MHPDLAKDYFNYADTYESLKQYSEALNYYQRAITIWKEVLILGILSWHSHTAL